MLVSIRPSRGTIDLRSADSKSNQQLYLTTPDPLALQTLTNDFVLAPDAYAKHFCIA
jgi:hypothetical protein